MGPFWGTTPSPRSRACGVSERRPPAASLGSTSGKLGPQPHPKGSAFGGLGGTSESESAASRKRWCFLQKRCLGRRCGLGPWPPSVLSPGQETPADTFCLLALHRAARHPLGRPLWRKLPLAGPRGRAQVSSALFGFPPLLTRGWVCSVCVHARVYARVCALCISVSSFPCLS